MCCPHLAHTPQSLTVVVVDRGRLATHNIGPTCGQQVARRERGVEGGRVQGAGYRLTEGDSRRHRGKQRQAGVVLVALQRWHTSDDLVAAIPSLWLKA